MDLRSLMRSSTPNKEQHFKPPPGHEPDVKVQGEYLTQQWLLRKRSEEQENYWVPTLKHNVPFPTRNALISGDAITKEGFPFRSTLSESTTNPNIVPDRILATTKTTQRLELNYEYRELGRPVRRESEYSMTTISAAHSSRPDAEEAFDLEMLRDSGPDNWNHMTASPSLDIIEDYEDEAFNDIHGDTEEDEEEDIVDDFLEAPRRPPSTLPPIPSLPPPSARSVSFGPRRSPRVEDEFDARGLQRQVSSDSASSSDPLDPAAYYTLSPPKLKATQQRVFSLVPPPSKSKKAAHNRSHSQSRLLPLHLNQAPCLTTDKPTTDEQRRSRVSDSVKMHLILLFVFVICPPMWLVLASGSLDTLLHVPVYPVTGRIDSLAAAQRQEFMQVRRVKQVAAVLGLSFWTVCLCGMVAGLALA